jgi:hypothetical protein
VPVDALDRVAVRVEGEALGAKGHTLVNTDAVADDGGFANHHACAVINEDPLADFGAGVDVNAGATVGVLGHDARNQWNVEAIQDMGYPVTGEGEDSRITKDRLGWARCRWIPLVGGDRIERKLLPNVGQAAQEFGRDPLGLAKTDFRCSITLVSLAGKTKPAVDLVDHDQRGLVKGRTHVVTEALLGHVPVTDIAGEDHRLQQLDDLYDFFARREWVAGKGLFERRCQLIGLLLQLVNDLRQHLVDCAGAVVVSLRLDYFQFCHLGLPSLPTNLPSLLLPCPTLLLKARPPSACPRRGKSGWRAGRNDIAIREKRTAILTTIWHGNRDGYGFGL